MYMSIDSEEPLERDPRRSVQAAWQGAVLLSHEIRFYANQKGRELIYPFNEDNLKPASYDLTLGSSCRLGGKPILLDRKKPYLIIPPYEVAVISTKETVKIPRFLIGRWNLRVRYVYEGLLWVGGPQVDPGYEGKLFCPLYNLSNRTVILEYEKTIATIDFVRTTPFRKGCEKFEPKRDVTISDHDIHGLRSGPLEAWKRVENIERRIDTFQATVFPLIALIFTIFAIIVGMPPLLEKGLEAHVEVPIFMTIIAAIATFLAGWVVGRNWSK